MSLPTRSQTSCAFISRLMPIACWQSRIIACAAELRHLMIDGKAPAWQWLDMESAARHVPGAGIWDWASNDDGDPRVMACGGATYPPWKHSRLSLCCAISCLTSAFASSTWLT